MVRILLGTAIALALAASVWGVWLEPTSLRVRSYRLEIPHWPEALADLRVAVIADLHIGSPFNDEKRLAEVIARTNATQADLILIAGDFLVGDMPGGREIPYERWIPLLERLRAPIGVFAVLGNQDHITAPKSLREQLHAIEFGLLEDEALELEHEGHAFWLVGVSDYLRGRKNMTGALAQVEGEDPAVLLFTHSPALFAWVPDRVSLTIAGHTHGGQISLPIIGPIVAPLASGRRFSAGHVIDEGRHIFVNTGIGTSILPIRFGVPPEISVLELFPLSDGKPAKIR